MLLQQTAKNLFVSIHEFVIFNSEINDKTDIGIVLAHEGENAIIKIGTEKKNGKFAEKLSIIELFWGKSLVKLLRKEEMYPLSDFADYSIFHSKLDLMQNLKALIIPRSPIEFSLIFLVVYYLGSWIAGFFLVIILIIIVTITGDIDVLPPPPEELVEQGLEWAYLPLMAFGILFVLYIFANLFPFILHELGAERFQINTQKNTFDYGRKLKYIPRKWKTTDPFENKMQLDLSKVETVRLNTIYIKQRDFPLLFNESELFYKLRGEREEILFSTYNFWIHVQLKKFCRNVIAISFANFQETTSTTETD